MTLLNKTAVRLKPENSGFTVIELMITISIVVLVTGLVMIQYASFNSSVLLTSQAYMTAFDIRETQSLAVSVRGQNDQFKEDYGVFFNMSSPDRYILFQDNDANGEHNPPRYHSGEEVGVPFRVDPRFTVLDICGTNSSGRTCGLSDLAISFKRPDFDAAFYSSSKSGMYSAEVQIGNENSSITKTILVYTSGQITVE